MSKPKKIFTVWFSVGLDFKETIEAEDVHDAQRRLEARIDDNYSDYVAQIEERKTRNLANCPITHIHDIAEVPDE